MNGASGSVRLSKEPPAKTGIGYKVFYLKNGKLYPPMVKNPGGSATPMGIWIDASVGEVTGYSKTGLPQVRQGEDRRACREGSGRFLPSLFLTLSLTRLMRSMSVG